jgi:pilus assembly protein Flp/PilA
MSKIRKFLKDEQGGEIMEYVLIAGLIIVGCVAAVTAFGGKVLARWNSVNSAF